MKKFNLKDKIKDKYNKFREAYLLPQVDVSEIKLNGGIYFDIIKKHTVSVQNQITDNYIESNRSIQDHIAKAPISVTLSGLSGELVFKPPTQTLDAISNVLNLPTNKLTALTALLPSVDNITQLAKNAVQYVEASYKRYEKIVKTFTNETDRETRLQRIYRRLISAREANTLFTIETPYTTFQNMAIQSITLSQGNENYITDIELTLKQIYIGEVSYTTPDKGTVEKYNEFARADYANQGKGQGKTVSVDSIFPKYY